MTPKEFVENVLASRLSDTEMLRLFEILDSEDTDFYEEMGDNVTKRFPELFNSEPPYEYELMTEKL